MSVKRVRIVFFLMATVVMFPTRVVMAQDDNKVAIEGEIVSNILRPAKAEATAARISQLKVPRGFELSVFARNVGHPRMMYVSDNGFVYVTDRDDGKLTLLKDVNKDGVSDSTIVLLEMEHLHGIAFHAGKLYLAAVKEIYTAPLKTNGRLGQLKPIITDLPDAGQHHNRTIGFGPDSLLYISIGSTCNSCVETNRESAAMLAARPDGSGRRIFSKGLRNTIGFDWHPTTKELWGWDNGTDHLGDERGREELNKLTENSDYGWPFVFEEGKPDRHHDPKNLSHAEYAAKCVNPSLTYTAHGASMSFIFYRGNQFPNEYRNCGFVAMRGSWNRKEPTGHCVLLVRYNDQGQPKSYEDFFSGFLIENSKSRFGRPVGLAQYIDGSLLVSDDLNGIIYKISYPRR
jgi:glucose/arabinose dehydrogenase